MPKISAVATALPPHRIGQAEVRDVCRSLFGDRRLLDIFERSGVEARYLAFPPGYYLENRSFEERNRDCVDWSLRLGEEVVGKALKSAKLKPGDIDYFFFVTTTGLATPSVDALLMARMGMRRDVLRTPIFGIGCAGGTAGIARAAGVLKAEPRKRALLLSVELCGQTFRNQDDSPVNVVGMALFGDGAAAAILEGDAIAGQGPAVAAWGADLFPGTRDVMGWEFVNDGMKLVLSSEVPKVVVRHVTPAVDAFLASNGLKRSDVRHFVLHPGGRRVLEAYESSLGVTPDQLRPSRDTLRLKGNLSSAAVLFILEGVSARPGDIGLMASVGPGFAVEMALLKW